MPTSITPEPKEHEFECANCGAYFHYELTRCPVCGINLYEPEDDPEGTRSQLPLGAVLFIKLTDAFHRIFKKPYSADSVFGDALDQSILYDDLLQKVGGDHAAAERLIEFERTGNPQPTRRELIQRAIQKWERDNRGNKA